MPDIRPTSPPDNHSLPLSQVPTGHHADDAPTPQRLPGKLQRIRLSRQSRLRRFWSKQWLHQQRKAYIHTFFDATISWFMVGTIIYINCAAVLVHRIDSVYDSEEFLKIHSYFQPVIAAFVGFAFGSVFKTVGAWKGKQISNGAAQAKKCIVIGQTRLPLWLYLCLTFLATFSLSFVASGGMKYLFSQGPSRDKLQVDQIWRGVVTALCAVSVLAVAADAVIRHKIFVSRARPVADSAGGELPRTAKIELNMIA
ncbi:hypothetical protein E8E14_013949 [Neopestalotiopsis sp. 37M]|nr:hypothetical protein E8E14_013949 [Neopestalotiopsis sp. 37M]